jgi:hypothetical protein
MTQMRQEKIMALWLKDESDEDPTDDIHTIGVARILRVLKCLMGILP